MNSSPPVTPTARLAAAAARVGATLGDGDVPVRAAGLGDDVLLDALTQATEARKALDLIMAGLSAEVGRRSTRDRGYSGLAQRQGHRNPTSLVQTITGQSRGDVNKAVRAGDELAQAAGIMPTGGAGAGGAAASGDDGAGDASKPVQPRWLAELRAALSSGRIGAEQFRAIRTGMGEPPVERYPELDRDFLPSAWAQAVGILLDEAQTLPVEELRASARIARDRLDPVGVTLRFEERFEARRFRAWIDENGQHHARIAFDDDAAAWVHTIMSAALRPRRGPRFVEDGSAERTEAAADERTNEQLQYDTLIAVLRAGAAADPAQAFGDRQPGVRILVEASAIAGGDSGAGGDAGGESDGLMRVTGVGHLEDGGQALPGGVVERYLCDAGAVPILRDDHGRPLDLGREQRLFSRRQRIAIAARDGGCLWPGCSAPVSWCEYHHIDHWGEDRGRTDVDDGVPLCRNCHMRLHNQRWRITRERDPGTGDDTYWLHGPPDSGTGRVRDAVPMPSKSPLRHTAA